MDSTLSEGANEGHKVVIATNIAAGLMRDASEGYETEDSKTATQFIIDALVPLIRVDDFIGVDMAKFLEDADDSFLPGFLAGSIDWNDAQAVKTYTENWFRNLPIMAAAGVGTVQSGVVEAVVTAAPSSSTEMQRLSVWERIRRFGRRRN